MRLALLCALAVTAGVLGVAFWVASAKGDGKQTVAFTPLVRGLDTPVYATTAPGDPATLYVVEQPGRIRIVRDGAVAGTFLDLRSRVRSGGEQGLLSLAFHPRYEANGRLYVDYTDLNGDTRVVEYRAVKGGVRPGSARQLLFVRQPYANHNGGQLQFDGKGFLYVGLGDGGSGGDPQNRAQNLQSRLGKLLRIDPLRKGAAWRVVGYGLRNPWRFSFDRANGNLWLGDVGQGAWEEIDFRPAARVGRLANYGWSRFEGRTVYDAAKPLVRRGDLVAPVLVYSHSSGCSVTGGYVYRGTAVAVLRGRYVYGDFCSGTVWSFPAGKSGRSGPPRVEGSIAQLSSFGEDGSGELYATSLGGTLYRLRS